MIRCEHEGCTEEACVSAGFGKTLDEMQRSPNVKLCFSHYRKRQTEQHGGFSGCTILNPTDARAFT